jgi:hypothetical protein
MKKIYDWLVCSSENPEQWSLTISSAGKSVVSLVALFATMKGIDPVVSVGAAQGLVNEVAVVVAAGLTVFHSINMVIGFGRKLANQFLG